jgi:membrane protein DedA with SNARE-associated domain
MHFPGGAFFWQPLFQVLYRLFPPYPGEFILAICGYLEYKKNIFESLTLFITYWCAIVAGNMALYTLGAVKGEALLNSRFVARWITEKNREKIKSWLYKYGIFFFLAAIYIPGMYLPTVFFSGVMKYKKRYAFTGMMAATLIHDIMLFLGGRYMGGNLQGISKFIATYRDTSLAVVSSVMVIYITYRIFASVKKKNQKQET